MARPRNESTETFSVPGASCGHCRAAISESVSRVPGVTDVELDLETKRVTVYGDDVDRGAVAEAIDEAGYEVA